MVPWKNMGQSNRSAGNPVQPQAQQGAKGRMCHLSEVASYPFNAIKGSSTSPYPTHSGGGGAWVSLSRPTVLSVGATAWSDHEGNFAMGSRLSPFLPPWQRITSDTFVLEVVRQRYSLPFVWRPPTLSKTPVKTLLPRLQLKRGPLWEEVVFLLKKGDIGTVQLSQGQGGGYSHYFLATKCTGGFRPILKLSGLNTYLRVSKFCM